MRSVVLALDGPAKCGKTTIVNCIAEEAILQASTAPGIIVGNPSISDIKLPDRTLSKVHDLQEDLAFNAVTKISAGNVFRAAALYKALLELDGTVKSRFDSTDTAMLRGMLARPGIQDVLQNDPNVGQQVTPVSMMLGVQALCGSIFCDSVSEAYHANGGGNLVVVDARDPVGHFSRNGLLGKASDQIDPSRVIPIYIDTPPEVAASRMPGDYAANLAIVNERRLTDVTREELPVVRPPMLRDDFDGWLSEMFTDLPFRDVVLPPYCLDNGEHVGLDAIQKFSARIAQVAQKVGHNLFQYSSPVSLCREPS